MTLTLSTLFMADSELVRGWRNADRTGLRTPFLLTAEMQAAFHREVISNRLSPHRYFAVRNEAGAMLACVGLTNCSFENGTTEISLVVDPARHGQGIGRESVRLACEEAFDRMRLITITGECYTCNPALPFWQKVVAEHHGEGVLLPRRKWWSGQLHGAWAFTIPTPYVMAERPRLKRAK